MDEKLIKSVEELGGQVNTLASELPDIKAAAADIEKTKADLADMQENATMNKAEIDRIGKDITEFRAMLEHNLGKSGANDWRKEFSDFVKAVYHVKQGKEIPDFCKAAADFVADVDAQGGYLFPRYVADEVTKLTLTHGQIWPNLFKFTMPAGAEIRVPWESTLGDVAFRSGATGAPGQGTAGTEEATPHAWGADTLRPDWVHAYVKIANEALTQPGISIADQLAMNLASKIIRKIEFGVLAGYDGTPTQKTNATAPHDGILYATNVNTQTPMATVTRALINTFIGECITDHEGAADTSENFLITTPSVAHVLKGTLTQQGLNWGDVAAGINQNTYEGYRFLTSPLSKRVRSTSEHDYIVLSPLNKIKVAWTGNFSVGFNDSLGWASNETWMMVSTHADYSLGNPDMHHCGSFTAYA